MIQQGSRYEKPLLKGASPLKLPRDMLPVNKKINEQHEKFEMDYWYPATNGTVYGLFARFNECAICKGASL